MILTTTPNPCVHKIVSFDGDPAGRVVVRPVRSRWQGGGKGINAARAAHRLGAEVRALTTHGGVAGRILLDGLAAEGIATIGVEVAAETRMSTFIHGVDVGTFREYLEHGGPVDAREEARLRGAFAAALDEATLVTLNGSLPEESFEGLWEWAVHEADGRGRRVVVDTYGPAARAAAEAGPWLLKANRSEVEGSFGVAIDDDAAREEFARARLRDGCRHVLVTDGARGAWLYSAEGRHRFVPPQIEELNPVGSGDAMAGALAARLDAGDALVDAVRVGVAAGAANATRVGVCDFELAEVEALVARVEVRSARFSAHAPT